jgi:NAD(P)-dependent dehydrogenase (short-subunit alcohol dehydrogenase family)
MSEIVTYPSLKDKVVLVTGGASGIGESIVKKFLEQGSKIAFIDKEEDFGQDLVKKLDSYNHKALFKKCDLVDIKSLKNTINEIRNELGKFSIVVNNAANDERHSIDDVTPEFWDNRFHINLRHYFFTIQSTYKDMKDLGRGSIVNIGSSSWMKSSGGMPGYTTAKSAVAGLTKTLARDLGEYNIRVNCVVPGWIMTEKQIKFLSRNPEMKKDVIKRQCIKRMLEPDDIAKVVLFFASEQSAGCTSQNYVVDGGVVS